MNKPIIFSCIALLAILGLSYQLMSPRQEVSSAMNAETAFEKYNRVGSLEYKMTYEPYALKKALVKNDPERIDQLKGHHYMTLKITNRGLNQQKNPVNGWEDLSEYLKDEFKNQFFLQVNGLLKPCVLHHAFTMPQKKDGVVIQLVFKDDGFEGQPGYFKQPVHIQFNDIKNQEQLNWTFFAEDLNSTPALNIKHNG